MLPRSRRLQASSDFKRVYGKGKSLANKYLVVYYLKNKRQHSRLGFSISKKFGKAVMRNRARRRLSEAFRRYRETIPGSYDIIIIARPAAAALGYHNMEISLKQLLDRIIKGKNGD